MMDDDVFAIAGLHCVEARQQCKMFDLKRLESFKLKHGLTLLAFKTSSRTRVLFPIFPTALKLGMR